MAAESEVPELAENLNPVIEPTSNHYTHYKLFQFMGNPKKNV
jgi:hypothetical protein